MIRKDYKHFIEYDTEGSNDCLNNGCDDICRCYHINKVVINYINIKTITDSIFDEIFNIKSSEFKRDNRINQVVYGFDKDIDKYCIDRILRINKIYKKDKWISKSGNGYYGDEVLSIEMKKPHHEKISNSIDKVLSLSTLKDKIEFLLIEEYGYLIETIKNKEYKIIEIKKEDISFGQEIYRKKITKEEYYTDEQYKLIKGICLFDGMKWTVIDGYHRFVSSEKEIIKIIGII